MRTLAALALALALAACGGGSSAQSSAAYVTAADAFKQAVTDATAPLTGTVDDAAGQRAAAGISTASDAFVRALQAIGWPDAAKADADKLTRDVAVVQSRAAAASHTSGADLLSGFAAIRSAVQSVADDESALRLSLGLPAPS